MVEGVRSDQTLTEGIVWGTLAAADKWLSLLWQRSEPAASFDELYVFFYIHVIYSSAGASILFYTYARVPSALAVQACLCISSASQTFYSPVLRSWQW